MLLSLDVPSVSRNYNKQTPYELALNSGYTECAMAIGNRLDVLLQLDGSKFMICVLICFVNVFMSYFVITSLF